MKREAKDPLLNRLREKLFASYEGDSDNIRAHRELGQYFGYPECCVEFWCFMVKKFNKRLPIGFFCDHFYGGGSANINYVQCPQCRSKLKAEDRKNYFKHRRAQY